jgi:phosphatidylserine decarboxylase
LILKTFVKLYRINMEEAELPLNEYKSLDELFTRRLRPGARAVTSDWIHPVDGVLTANGRIHSNMAFQVKGSSYPISKLLGEQRYDFEKGVFFTYYLCPTDYHRVHAPVAGEIVSVRHLQGLLCPVNEDIVNNVRDLFCQNERVVINMHTEKGPVAVVMVGATNVGQIEINVAPDLVTNLPYGSTPFFDSFSPPIAVNAGDELGAFHMGSTVVVIMNPQYSIRYQDQPQRRVRLGEGINSRRRSQ